MLCHHRILHRTVKFTELGSTIPRQRIVSTCEQVLLLLMISYELRQPLLVLPIIYRDYDYRSNLYEYHAPCDPGEMVVKQIWRIYHFLLNIQAKQLLSSSFRPTAISSVIDHQFDFFIFLIKHIGPFQIKFLRQTCNINIIWWKLINIQECTIRICNERAVDSDMLLFHKGKGLGLFHIACVIALVQQEGVERASILRSDGSVVSQVQVVVDGVGVQLLSGDVHVEEGIRVEGGVVHGVEDALHRLIWQD